MSIVQIITAVEELISVYNTLKADGTLDKLKTAESAIAAEVEGNKSLQDLLQKVEGLFKKA